MPELVNNRQFGTSAYSLGRIPTQSTSLNVSIRPPRTPSDDPANDPTSSPGHTKTSSPMSSPRSTGNGNSIWGSLAKDVGIPLGIASSVGAGASKAGSAVGNEVGSLSKGIGIDEELGGLERAVGEVPSEIPKFASQFNKVMERGPVHDVMDFGDISPSASSGGLVGVTSGKAPAAAASDSFESIISHLGDVF